jgi:hypothetical protein
MSAPDAGPADAGKAATKKPAAPKK